MQTVFLILAAYLSGSIPFGVIVAKLKGVDIMAVGSGNTGATNVTRVLGWRLGMLVFALDILKGVGPAVLAKSVTGRDDMAVFMGVVAVFGHMLSPFLKFKGGKGVATSLGALLGSAPLVGVIGFGVFLALFFVARIVSLSSLIAAIAVLVSGYLLGQGWAFFVVFGPLVAYIFIRHRSNIGRILKGEEPKLEFKKKAEPKEEDEDDGSA